jgi:hypothetical protein
MPVRTPTPLSVSLALHKLKPNRQIPDLTLRLLQRDFEELVASGFIPNCPAAAEDYIGGWLWYEDVLRDRSPAALRLVRSDGNDDEP